MTLTWPSTMSLGVRINMLVAVVIAVMFAGAILTEVSQTRISVSEEVTAANRATLKLLDHVRTTSGIGDEPQAVVRFFFELGRVRAHQITLYDQSGRQLYRSPPSAHKAGRYAPGWFTELVGPRSSRREMKFGPLWLVVETDPSRPILDAWDQLVELSATGLVALLATIGLVFWAVNREVQPFYRIVGGLRQLRSGDFSVGCRASAGAKRARSAKHSTSWPQHCTRASRAASKLSRPNAGWPIRGRWPA